MSESAKIPMDMLRLLAPLAAQAGIDLPGQADMVPQINLDEQTLKIAEQLGGLLSRCDIFARGDEVVTVEAGKMVPVSKDRFCTLIEEYVTCIKFSQQGPKVITMGKDMAAKVLECRQFTRRLPQLEGIVPVSVPVRRASGAVEWLAAGYDKESKVWCNDGVSYDREMSVQAAMQWLWDQFGEFEFAWEQEVRKDWIFLNRSFSVQIAAMLSTYTRLMLPTGTPRPLFLWVANQQGSGKSVLAESALAHVFGDVATVSLPDSREEFEKLLNTTAMNMRPYLFLDDAPSWVASNALNRFITSRRHAGRKLGGNEEFDVPNVTTVSVTANNLEITPDLMRRSLVCELFVPGDIEKRTFKRNIEPGYWSRPEVRAQSLAVMCALLKHWLSQGEPMGVDCKPTFEAWSTMIGGIVAALPDAGQGLGRPMIKAELPMSGDRRGEEWRQLLVSIAERLETEAGDDLLKEVVFTTHDIIAAARAEKLLEDLCGAEGDKDLGEKERKRIGHELKRWRGRELVTTTTRRAFRFGKRHQRRGAEYPLEWL